MENLTCYSISKEFSLRRSFLVVCFCLISVVSALAQSDDIYTRYDIYRPPFRVFLNKFSWSVSSGYGLTNYKHNLEGFYFYQDDEDQLIVSNQTELSPIFEGYGNWLNRPTIGEQKILDDIYDVPYGYLENPVNNPLLKNQQVLVDADTMDLGFAGAMPTVPILASVHYDINKFRLGLGFQYEQHFMRDLKPSVYSDVIRPYHPDFNKTHYIKWFGILGYEFYEYWDYTFVLELQVGRAKAGPQINTDALGIGQKFFTNIGVNIERNLSEYVRITLRPSYDLKRYIINMPDATSIKHTNNAFMIQAGISINIPEIPRSPIKSDHVQLKHLITDPSTGQSMEVRGQPMWKKQNPKIGENHRRLWRYKPRNKRKIDPY